MMEISADLVRELREKSGAGIMDCKRALRQTGGDLQGAIDFLRKEGMIKASKKSVRSAEEGLVAVGKGSSGNRLALVEVNCETDFVARTDQFQKFLREVARLVASESPQPVEVLLKKKMGEKSVEESLKGLVAQLGENIVIRRLASLEGGGNEKVGDYIHAGSKIGVLVKIRGAKIDETVVRDVAMHIAAMHPVYVDRRSVPESVMAREKGILAESPDLAGKPSHLLDKILEGKLSRFFSEVCLVEQPFIKDPGGKKTVGMFLQEKDPGAEVVEMVRYQVGSYA